MELIRVLREVEIYPDRIITRENEYGPLRKAVRIVLLDGNNNVALGYYGPDGDPTTGYNIPGGGIDEGETILEALVRESKEETGCSIKNIRELGMVMECGVGKNKKHAQENYCFIADLDGEKGSPTFSEEEIEDGLGLTWLSLDIAIEKLKIQKDSFGTRKTLLLLEKAKESIGAVLSVHE